jgi:peroxiredoxin
MLSVALTACAGHGVVMPGARASDFELPSLAGGRVALGDRLGRDVVLIDFWASFCEPCLAQMPRFDALYRRYRARGFVVLGVSVDDRDSRDEVRRAVERRASYPILFDDRARVLARYDPGRVLPYRVLIGRDGIVISKRAGYDPREVAALEREIEAALGGVSERSPPSAPRPTSASP